MKNIVILGSTGSIGRSTLDVIERNRDRFRLVALTAGSNIDLFEAQIKTFRPDLAVVADRAAAEVLRKRFQGMEILSGAEAVIHAAVHEGADFVISAIVGSAGLLPTIAAVRAGKTVGIANKESLVMAGDIVMKEAKKSGAKILPVDSEHSAVSQCIEGRGCGEVRRIILTDGRPEAPELEHGQEDYDRLSDSDEQGA
jgi:1-deoxy-D-xylulose-5-phosphate reductoisomerase